MNQPILILKQFVRSLNLSFDTFLLLENLNKSPLKFNRHDIKVLEPGLLFLKLQGDLENLIEKLLQKG